MRTETLIWLPGKKPGWRKLRGSAGKPSRREGKSNSLTGFRSLRLMIK